MEIPDLITVTRSAATINTVALLGVSKANEYEHILGAAQALGIDFIPITWQHNLEEVGRDATVEIRQSLLSLQTSLVFKRIRASRFSQRSKKAAGEGKTKAFYALISDISALALTVQHPNISSLLGVCWDVTEADREAWPVLVFKKAPRGNMDEFVKLHPEKAQSWVTRIGLIAGIARAVEYMHAHKTIHGDIKPRNVLVFEDDHRGYIAKVTDFGYSTVDVDDGLISLSSSAPWCYPGKHRNGYTFNPAAKMDAYSFGKACLWTFFHDAEDYPDSEILEQEKREGDMPGTAARMARSTVIYEDYQKTSLAGLFGMTLNHNYDLRSDFDAIVTYIEEQLGSVSATR